MLCDLAYTLACTACKAMFNKQMHALCVQADVAFWSSLVQYLNNAGEGADGKHNAITSFFMWAWDANADTEFGLGGLVESGEPRKLLTSEAAWHACL
jgi:hypothetical protein